MIKKLKKINIINLIKIAKFNFIQFVKYNRQYISFVVLTLISCILLRILTISKFQLNATFFDLSVIILLGSLAYFFKPKHQYKYFLIIMIVITILNIINTIYYAFFTSFVSFGLLASMGQTAEVTDAVFQKLKIYHFAYLIMPIIFIIIHKSLLKGKYFKKVEELEVSKRLLVGTAIIGGICLFINISTLKSSDISRFSKQWNREYIVQRFGIVIYQGNDLVQTVKSNLSSMFGFERAANNFNTYYEEHPYEKSNNKYTNKLKDYNVITIHMESIMQFLINLKINGKEVTPNLNKLVKESMYFDNFYPQVSVGTSSDTEFTMSSSLMPVQSGTVFVSYYNRKYITLQSLLKDKGYYTFSMHANKASMWNRNKMHTSLGYMDFYSQDYYDINETIGLGLSDKEFFNQSEGIIKDITDDINKNGEYKHYMGTMITLTNHTPFDIDKYIEDKESLFDVTYHTGKKDSQGNEIIYDYLEGTPLGDYIKSAHYADEALGEFINYVKSHDEYKKTLFVMYGDHAAQLRRKDFGYYVNYDFETGEEMTEDNPNYVNYDYYENEIFKKTPLILWTTDNKLNGKYSYPMGMIDILPTISNMLGIENKYQLGHDIFEVKNNNTVIFPNGNFLTNKVYYNNTKNETKIFSDYIIDENYIEDRKKHTEEILDLSNDIIVYNLIEKVGENNGE